MRELLKLRPEDIDRAAEVWKSWPAAHKGTWRGKARTVYVGPAARGVLAPFLEACPAGKEMQSTFWHARHTVSAAASLALVGPAAARRLLATLGPPDSLAEKAATDDRDWLFAFALADPERAEGIMERRADRAKAGPMPHGAGLSECASVRSADDRFADLAGWLSSLARPVRDSD